MDDRVTRDLLRRLRHIERRSVRLRRGVVTGASPLDVALGGSDTSYQDVPAVGDGTFEVDDQVVVLMAGNELIVLGALGATGEGGEFNTVLTTSGRPSDGTGNDGDFAYDPTAIVMYGPKASGRWPAGVSLRGEDGEDGTNGIDGADGDDGAGFPAGTTHHGIVTALPGSPARGDRCTFNIPGVAMWEFIYNATDGYWYPEGKPLPLTDESTSSTEVGSSSYVGSGPSIRLPVGGDFYVGLGVTAYVKGACTWFYSYKIGATAASDSDALVSTRATTFDELPHYGFVRPKTGLAASTVLLGQYRNSTNSVVFSKRQITATPIRVR